MIGRFSFLYERILWGPKAQAYLPRTAEWSGHRDRPLWPASLVKATAFCGLTIGSPAAHAQWTQVPGAATEKTTVGEPESSPPKSPSPLTPGDVPPTGEQPSDQRGDGAESDEAMPLPVPAGDTPPAQDPTNRPPQPPADPSNPLAVPTISLESGGEPHASIQQRPDPVPTPVDASKTARECAPAEDPKHKFTSMVLIEGVGRYGGFVEGPNLEDESAPTKSHRAAGLGAQATLGFIPGGRTFMMAGRLQGGAYLGSDITSGTIGAAVLFGANLARKTTGRTFSYVLGGFGVEYIPQKKQDILTLHISGGTVVRGLDFGADIDLGGNDEFARFMLGMHLGWGRLL